jgi:hypothetical protein
MSTGTLDVDDALGDILVGKVGEIVKEGKVLCKNRECWGR